MKSRHRFRDVEARVCLGRIEWQEVQHRASDRSIGSGVARSEAQC